MSKLCVKSNIVQDSHQQVKYLIFLQFLNYNENKNSTTKTTSNEI